MARTLVFDLDETLLDPEALDIRFSRQLGRPGALALWQRQLQHMMLVDMVTGRYHAWDTLAQAALTRVAQREGRELPTEAVAALHDETLHMPARTDADAALHRLRQAGHGLVVLTNLPRQAAVRQLQVSGLEAHFDEVLSAEAVHRFKPAREPYRMTAEHLSVPPDALRLVSARSWDVTGAVRAGLQAAYVDHSGLPPVASEEPVDLRASTIGALSERLIEAAFGQTFPG